MFVQVVSGQSVVCLAILSAFRTRVCGGLFLRRHAVLT